MKIKLVEVLKDENKTGFTFESMFISSCDGVDLLDDGVYYFYDPVIKHDVKNLKAGDKIYGFILDTTNSTITYELSEECSYTFKFEMDE